MKMSTIAFATVFAISTLIALAPAQARHHHHKHHHIVRPSGPGLEPGAPDASRPGGKGVSNRPSS